MNFSKISISSPKYNVHLGTLHHLTIYDKRMKNVHINDKINVSGATMGKYSSI